MMNNKMKMFIATLCFVLVSGFGIYVYAASEKNEGSLAREISKETNWKIGRMEEILDKNLNMPLENLPIYSFSQLNRYVGNRFVHLNLNSIGNDLFWFHTSAGQRADNIQKIDNEHLAVVYQVAEEDIAPAYMAVVFERKTIPEDNYEYWEKTGEAYFFDKLHCFDEYSTVVVGDKVETLYTLDPSLQYDVLRSEPSVYDMKSGTDVRFDLPTRMIYKILSDGVLTVEYREDSGQITDIAFSPYDNAKSMESMDYVSIKNASVLSCFTEKQS